MTYEELLKEADSIGMIVKESPCDLVMGGYLTTKLPSAKTSLLRQRNPVFWPKSSDTTLLLPETSSIRPI